MAIPKEPRQLMINIMYLVLTALLALNVSAEVFNAFKMVDKGLKKSNVNLDQGNSALPAAIIAGAKKKASLQKYADLIEPGRQLSGDLNKYIQGIIDTMINDKGYTLDRETGAITDDLKGKKDYDITTRYLVDGPKADGNGKGTELMNKLMAYREGMSKLVADDPDTKELNENIEFMKNVSVQIDNETWQKKGKPSWAHMNFSHMPLQAVLPIFSKFQNDVKSSEAAFLNYLAGKVGTTTDVVIDKYTVVSAPEKSYIIKGEKYKSEIFLSAAASADSKTGISVSVDGRKLPLNSEGIGVYETTASALGKKSYTAAASITNPVTGETKSYKKQFTFEVGERSVAVSATKMNVFYIGVPNPVSVTAAGVASGDIKVSMAGSGGGTIKRDGGNYVVNVKKPTRKGEFAKITVKAPGLNESRDFRVKRIPDPVPKLGQDRGGAMPSGKFSAMPGVFPVLEGFDFDAKCAITEFVLVRAPKRQDVQIEKNKGGKFSGKAASLVKKAKSGDKYFFENIKCKCPGDGASRPIGSMVFNIK